MEIAPRVISMTAQAWAENCLVRSQENLQLAAFKEMQGEHHRVVDRLIATSQAQATMAQAFATLHLAEVTYSNNEEESDVPGDSSSE